MLEERNAVITNAEICLERGLLTSWITVEWSGGGQGFGGYHLGGPEQPAPHAGIWIHGVLRAAGVEAWSELVGKVVRIRHTHEKIHAIGRAIHGVGHAWFTPSDAFPPPGGE